MLCLPRVLLCAAIAIPPADMVRVPGGRHTPFFATRSVPIAPFYIDRYPATQTPTGPPITNVTLREAVAWCRARGKRLLTTLEWEFAAARGVDPAQQRARIMAWMGRPPDAPIPNVGQWESALHIFDMHGLIWEWTADYYQFAPPHHLGCAGAAASANDPSDYPAFLRYGVRGHLQPDDKQRFLGFRCARDAEP